MNGRFRSPLASVVSSADPGSDAEIRAMAERAWIEKGVVLLKTSWFPDPQDRARLIELVGKVHGERRGAGV